MMKAPDAGAKGLHGRLRSALLAAQDGLAQGLQVFDELRAEYARLSRVAAELRQRLGGDLTDDQERALQALMVRVERMGALMSQSAAFTEEAWPAMEELSRAAREMGTQFEIAQQGRGLGLHAIRVQEEERRHLARELHDGPAQLLNSVVLRADVCQRLIGDPERLQHELVQLKELVKLSLQDVRKVIFNLRPMALDDLGLVPALRGYLKEYQARTGIETDFAFYGTDRRYHPALEIALFRLCQEALTNVEKHAGASRVWVTLEAASGKEVKLTVKDDGVGFDPESVRSATSVSKFGLVGMRERVELLNGSLEIQSSPGSGTKLTFVFPPVD